jgi:hypothetical protein
MNRTPCFDPRAPSRAPTRAGRRPALLMALGLLALLGACHGVDPLLAAPPSATRPDAVLRTPPELLDALAQAAHTEAEVRALFTQPLWSDALAQAPDAFAAALAARQPALTGQAGELQRQLGTLFTQAAALGTAARQLQVRLSAMDEVRRQTRFNAYVAQRADVYNRRADALRAAQRAGGAAAAQALQADTLRGVRDSGKVERIDYVNSAGRVVESRYTAAHDDKQRARMLLPFVNAAAREQAEQAAAQTEQAQRLSLVLEATRDSRMDAVERQLFDASDLITGHSWPQLETRHRAVREAIQAFTRLSSLRWPPTVPSTPSTPNATR